MFLRAADKAKLLGQIVERSIDKISELVLPVVLLLKDKQAVILVEKHKGNKVTIVFPDSLTSKTLSISDLAGKYSGYAIFTKTKFEFDARSGKYAGADKAWFWPVIKRSWKLYAEVILASLCINLFAVVSPMFTMNVYDRVVPNQAYDTLYVLALGVGSAYAFDFIMKMLRGFFIDAAGKKADVVMSAKIFSQMMGIRLEGRPEAVGSYASNVHQFESCREFFASATISALIDAPFILFFLSMIYYIGGSVVLVPIAMIPLVVISGLIIQRPLNKIVKESYKYSSQKQAMLVETLSSLDTVKISQAEGILQRKWEQVIGMSAKLSAKTKMLALLATSLTAFSGQIANVGVVIMGVHKIGANEITMGALIASTILTGRALAPLSQIASLLTRYHQSMTALQGVDKMMQLPTESMQSQSPLFKSTLEGKIVFDNVSFAYPKQTTPAIHEVSFTINPGEKVAIIGRIGSGKSTIQRLIARMYSAQEGKILIDNLEINQLDITCLRKNLGYVPQDVNLMYGTIKDNIKFGMPTVGDERLVELAELVGLTDFISKSPEGFNTQVGERGAKLSGGQRQAITIARSLLSSPQLLLMDEPTNMLDSSSEEIFKQKLRHVIKDCTLVLVTHKGSLLSLVDRIIVMDNGRVTVDGERDKVLQYLAELKNKSGA